MKRLLSEADVAVLIGPVRSRRLGLSNSGPIRLERFLRRRMWRLRREDLAQASVLQFDPIKIINEL